MISQIKPLKIKSFLPFNFAVTAICVAIRLAKDGTRMGGIWFRLSPSNNSIERGVKLDNKAPFHCKFLVVFADDIGLINY